MNFYPFHLGDYVAHTAHLDPLEDIAYRRLLDLYYQRESALVGNAEQLARMIRMRQYEEIVSRVLVEFFEQQPDASGALPLMWRNRRANIEIEKYRSMKNGGKKGAEKRWGKKPPTSPADGQADEPPKDGEIPSPMPPPCPPHTGSQSLPHANQEPLTKNQEDSVESLSRDPPLVPAREATESSLPHVGSTDEPPQLMPLPVGHPSGSVCKVQPTAAGRICWAMRAAGVQDVNPSHAKLLELLGQREPDITEFVFAAQQAKDRGKGFAYALAIVDGNRRAAVTAVATRPANQVESFRERDRRIAAERVREFAPAVADRLAPGLPPAIVIDATPIASQAEARMLT